MPSAVGGRGDSGGDRGEDRRRRVVAAPSWCCRSSLWVRDARLVVGMVEVARAERRKGRGTGLQHRTAACSGWGSVSGDRLGSCRGVSTSSKVTFTSQSGSGSWACAADLGPFPQWGAAPCWPRQTRHTRQTRQTRQLRQISPVRRRPPLRSVHLTELPPPYSRSTPTSTPRRPSG